MTREQKRKLTHQGVQLFNLFYNLSELTTLRIRPQRSLEVAVRFDPENLGRIWVYDDMHGDYLLVPSAVPEYAEGLTLRQHQQILSDAKRRGLIDQDSLALLASKDRFSKRIEELSHNRLLRERKKAARDARQATDANGENAQPWRSNPQLPEASASSETPAHSALPLSFETAQREIIYDD